MTTAETTRDVPDIRPDIGYPVSGGYYPVICFSSNFQFLHYDSQLKYTDLNSKVVNFITKKRQHRLVCTVIIDGKLSFYLFTIHYAAANQKIVALCDDC